MHDESLLGEINLFSHSEVLSYLLLVSMCCCFNLIPSKNKKGKRRRNIMLMCTQRTEHSYRSVSLFEYTVSFSDGVGDMNTRLYLYRFDISKVDLGIQNGWKEVFFYKNGLSYLNVLCNNKYTL